jgi:hypothetical protein
MKLTKNKLIYLVKDELEKLGFTYITDSLTGAQGLFAKNVKGKYYITLGLEISRHYDSRFSASYYLSKTTRWSSVWGDIPRDSFERVGVLLQRNERNKFLSDEFNREGVVDAWWDIEEPTSIPNFIETIKISEVRFQDNKELINSIDESFEIAELLELAQKTKDAVKNKKICCTLEFQPNKIIDEIPFIWFEAAESVLRNNKGILNKNTVKLLAADAWRQVKLEEKI